MMLADSDGHANGDGRTVALIIKRNAGCVFVGNEAMCALSGLVLGS